MRGSRLLQNTKRHFRLSPSAASRWINCPGSLKLSAGIKRESSVYADEGTEAHAVGEEGILTGKDAKEITDNAEMAAAVQVYLDEIRSVARRFDVIAQYTERTLEHTSITDLGGTADHYVLYVDDDKTVCHVFDYKHGVGVPVDVRENKQVLTYFAIIASHFPPDLIDIYRATIVQPRAFSGDDIQTWECDHERVAEHEALIKEVSTQEHLVAGDHCRWCPAIQRCPKLREHTLEVARLEFDEVKDDREKLVEIYQVIPAIKALIERIPAALIETFRDGSGGVPGYKVVETLTNRQWKFGDEAAVLRNLKNKLGIGKKDACESKLKSPPAIEKMLSTKEQKEALAELVTRRPSGYKLVAESAKGEAVDFRVSEFSVIEGSPDGQAD